MKPIIIDEDTGRRLWTAAECADQVGISRAGWRGYVSRSQAPASVGGLDERTPLWDATEVERWQRDRPGTAGRPPSKS